MPLKRRPTQGNSKESAECCDGRQVWQVAALASVVMGDGKQNHPVKRLHSSKCCERREVAHQSVVRSWLVATRRKRSLRRPMFAADRALCAKRFFDDLAVCSCDTASFFDGVAHARRNFLIEHPFPARREKAGWKACVRSQLSAGRCVQSVFCSCDTASFSTCWMRESACL